ncbi:MAG: DUF2752 domain-containing protein [Muribaculaceae bacterium]
MKLSRATLWIVIGIGLALFVTVYLVFDPSNSQFFPKCPFHMLTGLKCPGCGSQRTIHALLNLQIAQAWHHNALLVASLPLIALLAVADILNKRMPQLHRALFNPFVSWTILAIVLLWWILRNIFNW